MLAKHALRGAILEYRRAIGLTAVGVDSSVAWNDFRDALRDAIESALMGGVAVTQTEVERAEPTTSFESPFLVMDEEPKIGPFERAIRGLRATVLRSGAQAETLAFRASSLADQIVAAERTGGSARLIARLQAVIARQEREFFVSGASSAQAGGVRNVIAEYMRDIGRPFDRQKFDGYSGVLRPIQQQLGVCDNRADTIVRTNTLRAYNGAHAERLERPDVRRVIPLVMLVEIHDTRTRGAPHGIYATKPGGRNPGNHWMADGLVGTMEQFRSWNVIPPNGYRCRASIRGLTLAECEEMGFLDPDTLQVDMAKVRRHNGKRLDLITSGLYPDPGFKRGVMAAAA